MSQQVTTRPFDQEYRGMLAIQVSSAERLAFIKKVYALFSLAICVFGATAWAGIEFGFGINIALKIYSFGFIGMLLMMVAPAVAMRMAMTRYPLNLAVLLGFAVFEGILVGGLIAIFTGEIVGGALVLTTASTVIVGKAAAMTGVTFTGLTLYALTTKKDFNFLGGMLFTGMWILVGFGVLSWFLGFDMGNLYSLAWVVLLSGFVLYDTSKIMRRFPTNMAAAAAVCLFIDFVYMFKHLLLLLSSRD